MRSRWEQPLGKTLDLQCQNRAMTLSSRKSRVLGNMHVFVARQNDVLNMQLVSLLSWNNPSSEAVTIYRHLNAKGKHLLDDEGVYNI